MFTQSQSNLYTFRTVAYLKFVPTTETARRLLVPPCTGIQSSMMTYVWKWLDTISPQSVICASSVRGSYETICHSFEYDIVVMVEEVRREKGAGL